MSEQFVEVLLDGTSILDNVSSFRLDRRRNQAVDTLTLRLADFSLYSSFDFGSVPTTERIHVGTSTASPKIDGSTVSTDIFTSAGSDFTAEGVTTDDILFIILSDNKADEGGHDILSVGTTTLTVANFTFGTASGIKFIILKNEGRFFIEKPDVIDDEKEIAIPSLWGRNSLARLTDPFVNKLTKTFPKKQNFSDFVKDLVKDAGMDETKIIIDIDDFVIPGNLLTISNQLPLQAITNVARKTNGYVRCQKTGDIHIKKDFFHFDTEPIAETIDDDRVRQLVERTDFPEFGNRVLVRSVTPEAAEDARISLTLETACIRGDGKAPVTARAVVTDLRGNAIANNTAVAWTVDNPFFVLAAATTLTRDEVQVGEAKRSGSLLTVSTDLPIREIIGVFLKMDTQRLVDFFPGGTFIGRTITLGTELPFSNTLVAVDYIASGIATNVVRSVAQAPEGQTTFVSALVGRIRDSVALCIRNTRNIFITLDSDPSELNVCLVGSQNSIITARVRDNGETAQLIGINWGLIGLGSISTSFQILRDTNIVSEIATSSNIFRVNTKYPISSVVGVWRADDGKSSTNHFTTSTHRSGTFDDREILLGTNLPQQRDRVIIEYRARSTVQIEYVAPENQTAPSVVFITATIDDGTALGVSDSEEILLTFQCPDGEGNIAGYGPQGLPTERRIKEPDCERSGAAAVACDIGDPNLNDFTECVCGFLVSGGCPTDDAGCRSMCTSDYNFNGFSSLLCETEKADAYCKRETGLGSLLAFQDCIAEHKSATIDACVDRCLNHEQDIELAISPASAVMDCSPTAQTLTFSVSGGSPPFSWSVSNPEGVPGIFLSEDTVSAIIQAPVNTIPAGSGPASINQSIEFTNNFGVCSVCNNIGCRAINCDGSQFSNCLGAGGCCPSAGCGFILPICKRAGSTCSGGFDTCLPTTEGCAESPNATFFSCDIRTGAQIAGGCVPCDLSMAGAVVTVTDSFGNEAMATIQTNTVD